MRSELTELEKVTTVFQWLKEKKLSAYKISLDTERRIPQMSLLGVLKGKSKVENITFRIALEIAAWYDEHYQEYVEDEV